MFLTFVDWLVVCAGAGAAENPGSESTKRVVRIVLELTPTTCRIGTEPDRLPPINFCCRTHISRAMLRAREAHPSGSS